MERRPFPTLPRRASNVVNGVAPVRAATPNIMRRGSASKSGLWHHANMKNLPELPDDAEVDEEIEAELKAAMVGRPSKYKKAYCNVVQNMRLLGYKSKDIADVLNVTEDTLSEWRSAYEEFSDAWFEGGPSSSGKVARSLFKRAVGYKCKAVKVFYDKDMGPVEHEYIQRFPPDTSAAIFWLTNKEKAHWRHTSATEISGPGGTQLQTAPSIQVLVVQSPKTGTLIDGTSALTITDESNLASR